MTNEEAISILRDEDGELLRYDLHDVTDIRNAQKWMVRLILASRDVPNDKHLECLAKRARICRHALSKMKIHERFMRMHVQKEMCPNCKHTFDLIKMLSTRDEVVNYCPKCGQAMREIEEEE